MKRFAFSQIYIHFGTLQRKKVNFIISGVLLFIVIIPAQRVHVLTCSETAHFSP